MPAEIVITPAVWPQDIEQSRALLAHYGQYLNDSPVGASGFCLIGYEEELRSLPRKFDGKKADLLVARNAGEPAGCVAVSQRILRDGRLAAEMKRLWVEPKFRGFGLGRELVGSAIAWARSHACAAVVLDTVYQAMPEAVALYRSFDFQETERFNDNPISGVRFYILSLQE